MTVQKFLQGTTRPRKIEIAKECGVHLTQVYRWEAGQTTPLGRALLRLIHLSMGKISADSIPAAAGGWPRPTGTRPCAKKTKKAKAR